MDLTNILGIISSLKPSRLDDITIDSILIAGSFILQGKSFFYHRIPKFSIASLVPAGLTLDLLYRDVKAIVYVVVTTWYLDDVLSGSTATA